MLRILSKFATVGGKVAVSTINSDKLSSSYDDLYLGVTFCLKPRPFEP